MKNNIRNTERKTCLGRLMKNEQAEQKGKGGRREKERKEMSLAREGGERVNSRLFLETKGMSGVNHQDPLPNFCLLLSPISFN